MAPLARPDAAVRPVPAVWSPLEYACHVRDVHAVFAVRVRRMLSEDVPTFVNWDQDATAVERRYAEQDPAVVDVELIDAAGTAAGLYATVTPATAGRRIVRQHGSAFTIETLGSYHLHDMGAG